MLSTIVCLDVDGVHSINLCDLCDGGVYCREVVDGCLFFSDAATAEIYTG